MKKIIFILLFFITQYSFSLTPHHRYFCADGGSATYTIADIDLRNVSVYNFNWYSDENATTSLSTSEILVNNSIYYLINNTGSSVHSFTIHIEDSLPAPILDNVGASVYVCEYYAVSNLKWLIPYNENNDLIYWFTANDNTGIPLNEYDYFGNIYYSTLYGFLSLDDCTTASVSIDIDIDENLWQYVYGDSPQYFLSADNPTVSDIIVTNNYYWSNETFWFNNPFDYPIPNDTPLVNNGEYYGYPENYIYNQCDWYAYPFTIKLDHNSINGHIKFDYNNDGCDINDIIVPNVRVTSTNGTNTFTTFSRNGNYTQHISNILGDFTTTIDVPYYFDVNPNLLETTFNEYNSYSNPNSFTGDFCLTANQNAEDVSVDILTTPIRPGFDTSCRIIYQNKGTQQANGNITFNYNDSKLSYLSTDGNIVSQTANSITFSYSNLNPFETNYINISFNAFQPPITNIDDVISFDASITPLPNDETPSDNTVVVDRTVIDSFDPNDITCVEGNSIEQDAIGKYLHYIIRFENTGSAEAINIKIENQLDAKLNWNTFEVISSSHDNRVAIKDGAISFIFSHVNLPFLAPQSQGYIYYKIKPKQDVVLGDIFENQAHIFFDFNQAIDTNVASTEIVNTLSVNENTLLDFSIFPTPTENILNIKSRTKITKIEIYSKLGQLIKETTENKIDISNLTQGLYFVKVKDINGDFGMKKMVKK